MEALTETPSLPPELWDIIRLHLPAKGLFSGTRVCRSWRDSTAPSKNHFWRAFFAR